MTTEDYVRWAIAYIAGVATYGLARAIWGG